MVKHRIAILTGGPASEREISLLSAQNIMHHIDQTQFEAYLIDVTDRGWIETNTGTRIDRNDFSLTIEGVLVRFEAAILMIHGHPAEDGCLQGYFEELSIPVSTCNTAVSSLTFTKYECNVLLQHYGILSARSRLITDRSQRQIRQIDSLDYPLFVKPNANGSSYGVAKVMTPDVLMDALDHAFSFGDRVMVEEMIHGREFTCGAVLLGDELHILPITEIISHNDFFDYGAKYRNESEEITPARLSTELTEQCRTITRRIYECLGCNGIIRVDFILKDRLFYVIEVNTIPGMTERSLVPQQIAAMGWDMTSFITRWIESILAH